MRGIGIAVIPMSWALGVWTKDKANILAIGPVRLVYYHGLGTWKGE